MKRYLLASLLLGCMSLTSLFAQVGGDAKPPETKPQSEDAKAIVQRLEAIEKTLQRIVDQQEQLRLASDALKQEIQELRSKMAAGPVTAKKPEEPIGSSSTLIFENHHPTMNMDVRVNGQNYLVAPGGRKSIMVAPGRVSYQVLQTDPQDQVRVRDLKAGEIKTITMR